MTTCITSVGWTLERGEETRPPDWQREFKRRPSFSRISKRPNCVGSKVETSPHPSISVQLFNFLGLLVRFLTSSSRRCSVARWPLRFVRALSCLSSINNSGNNKFCWPFFFCFQISWKQKILFARRSNHLRPDVSKTQKFYKRSTIFIKWNASFQIQIDLTSRVFLVNII